MGLSLEHHMIELYCFVDEFLKPHPALAHCSNSRSFFSLFSPDWEKHANKAVEIETELFNEWVKALEKE